MPSVSAVDVVQKQTYGWRRVRREPIDALYLSTKSVKSMKKNKQCDMVSDSIATLF